MKKLRNIWVVLLSFMTIIIPYIVIAQDTIDVNWFSIIPKLTDSEIADVSKKTEEIWQTWGNVWDAYTKAASGMSTPKQIASWIMNWDTIMDYLVFFVKFLSQLWITVGVIFIMYAWYKYMISVFNWSKVVNSALKNAIIWVIIVIFSYAIMKTLTSFVWLS